MAGNVLQPQELHPFTDRLLSTFPILNSASPFLTQQLGDCYAEIFLKLNITNSQCLQLVISKGLGYGIVLFGALVKIPQIVKLLSSKAVTGVSFSSYVLETMASSIFVAYNMRNENPFSTFGESAFINIQNLIIMLLICLFKSRYYGMAIVVLMWGTTNALLVSNEVLSDYALEIMSGAVIPLSLFSKLPQILAIIKTGHVRNLSSLTVGAYFAGSVARMYTTLQEVDDKIILSNYVLSSILNFILVAQVLYYKFAKSKLSESTEESNEERKPVAKRRKAKKLD